MINKEDPSSNFIKWVEQICSSEKPDRHVIAYNFGLFESENGYMVYLTGSKQFDEDDSDWACEEDFIPENKYHLLEGTAGENWLDIQVLIEDFIRHFLSRPEYANCFLVRAMIVSVGFDDGDLTIIAKKPRGISTSISNLLNLILGKKKSRYKWNKS